MKVRKGIFIGNNALEIIPDDARPDELIMVEDSMDDHQIMLVQKVYLLEERSSTNHK